MIHEMVQGHLATAKELGIDISIHEAINIAWDDMTQSTCIIGDLGEYVVYKTSKSITGDIHILTKLYVPKEHRGKGYARALLNRCETPLVKGEILKEVRPCRLT